MSDTIRAEDRPWGAPINANDEDRPHCVSCRYFRRKGQRCQRFPPTIIYDVSNLERVTLFPQVATAMWCGEYASQGYDPAGKAGG